MPTPAGIRRNNPGDVEALPNTKWLGQLYVEDGFVVFDNPENGIRALAIDLKNQQDIHGLNTVSAIFTKYAPPSENDTPAYIAFVAKRLGVDPRDKIDLHNPQTLADMVVAVIIREVGSCPYDFTAIDSIVNRVLGVNQNQQQVTA